MLIRKFLILFFLFFSINVYSQDKWNLKDINFHGLNKFSVDLVKNYIDTKCGNVITLKNINKLIFVLLNTGQFENIKIIQLNKKLSINLQEKSIAYSIDFNGHHILTDSIVRKLFNIINSRFHDELNENVLKIFKNIILNFYKNIGRYNIDVNYLFFKKSDNTVNVKIIITEHNNISIKKINILGNKVFSQNKILSFFKLNNECKWGIFKNKETYDVSQLLLDLDKLRNFYIENGYIFFSYNSIRVVLSSDKTHIVVNINLKEGEQFHYSNNLFLHGNVDLYFREINKFINEKINNVININSIVKLTQYIDSTLFKNGFLNNRIYIYSKIDKKNKIIYFHISIDSGPRYSINKVYFFGNKLVQNKVLRSKVKQKEGDLFNWDLLTIDQKNVQNTGYFDVVKLEIHTSSKFPNRVNVVYVIKEKNNGSIQFSLGYGIDSGLCFNVDLVQRNLLGLGSTVRLSGIKNTKRISGELEFFKSINLLFNNNLKGKFFYHYFNSDNVKLIDYSQISYGFNTDLELLINKRNTLNLGVHYVHNNKTNVIPDFSIWSYLKSFDLSYKKHGINDVIIDFEWTFNNLNNYNFSTIGNCTTISGKTTTFGSDSYFNKIQYDSVSYYPLSKSNDIILLMHMYFGLGHNSLSVNKELPFYNNFSSSSIGSIRGFQSNSIESNHNTDNNKKSDLCMGNKHSKLCQSQVFTGSDVIITNNYEIMKIFSINNDHYPQKIKASLFFDVTSVLDKNWSLSLDSFTSKLYNNHVNQNKIRMSTGITLQWISPIGPLNVSFSYPLKHYINDKLEPLQFSIGKVW
ncbi:outer membrane protein assembly factor BamA [Buchnera aphidicola (Formosaphis micheliae)]|uniref:outer membrane protein assembly factor BamA n=1 Tax=Buchnera aphidicola TaxID=9 RepID=UPI0031CC64CC